MVAKYDQLSVQGNISSHDAALLADEKQRVLRYQRQLRGKLDEALTAGQGMFQGVQKDGADLGKNLADIISRFVEHALPKLYSKFELGAYRLEAGVVVALLRTTDLGALPAVVYAGENGMGLVAQSGGKYVFDMSTDIAKEVLDYLRREQQYGNKVTGKTLEDHFGGFGYGWEPSVVQLVLAALLRAGAIEVTYQGHRYRNANDPQSRAPFEKTIAFRSTSFAPRESISIRTLASAAENYEELTGDEVDVEEGAIADALKRWADGELRALLSAVATARANRLPVVETLEEYQHTLEGIGSAPSDDCVRALAGGEGVALQERRDTVRKIRPSLTDSNLATIQEARMTLDDMLPALQLDGKIDDMDAKEDELRRLLDTGTFYESMPRIAALSREIHGIFRDLYLRKHNERHSAFSAAVDAIKGREEWIAISESLPDMVESILKPLTDHICADQDQEAAELLPAGAARCRACHDSLTRIEYDLASLSTLNAQALSRLEELVTGPDGASRIERLRLVQYFPDPLDTRDRVNEAVDRLRERLYELVDEGVMVVLE